MAGKNLFGTTLIAPCGMNCAICMAHLRTKNRCGGCHSPDRLHHRNCFLFSCQERKGRFCYTCSEFPCGRLKQLDKRYRTRYGMSMLANLEAIRQDGIRAFVRNERERWTCRECGGTIDVHHGCCSACGRRRE